MAAVQPGALDPGPDVTNNSEAQLQAPDMATDSTWKCPSVYALIIVFCELNTVCPDDT
jgi:hypothetical protein